MNTLDFKYFFKGSIAWFILNIILLPAYFWMVFILAMGIGVIEHMSIIEKLPFLLVSIIPCAIEYVIIYLVVYKSNKFNIIFSKYIIGVQGILMVFFICGFLG